MPRLKIKNKEFDCGAVVFDKDGTLIDFHAFWVTRAINSVERLRVKASLSDAVVDKLYASVGLSPETKSVSSTGPMATAPLYKYYVVAACVLYQNGWSWHDAENAVTEYVIPVMTAPADMANVQPIGDVKSTFVNLKNAGLGIVIATADDRHITEDTLDALELTPLVDLVLCGDDDFVEGKPSADVLRYTAEYLSLKTSSLMMVGDTVGDMLTGVNGKAGAIVAVRGGASSEQDLLPYAHAVVDSIEEIQMA